MGWSEKFNQITKTAVTKSKEVAEITKLNMEINSAEQKIRELATQIGLIVADQKLLADNEPVAALTAQIEALRETIAMAQGTIRGIKNLDVCPNCGAQVSRTSRFCDKCGHPMERPEPEEPAQAPVCPACGAPLEPEAAFCSNCGTKLSG